jgi:biopolymer transport protein ExbD
MVVLPLCDIFFFVLMFFFQILPLSKTAFKNVAIIGPNGQEHQYFVTGYGPHDMPMITVEQVWMGRMKRRGKGSVKD